MATRTKASKNDHITTLLFVLSLTARWIRSRTSMYSCSCLAPANTKLSFDFTGKCLMGQIQNASQHSVEITGLLTLSRIFGKNFVKVTVILNKLLKNLFDEIFFR